MMSNNKAKIILIIYMFLLLFAPPIIKDVNLLLVLTLFSSIILLTKYQSDLKSILKNKQFLKVLTLLIVYYVWYLLVIVGNYLSTGVVYLYNSGINLYSMLLVVPCAFICCLHIFLYAQKKRLDFNELLKLLIFCGLIQAVIAIVSFICPPFKRLLIEIMYYNTGNQLYVHEWSVQRRFFGFANNLLDSFGFGTAVLACLPLFYSIKNGKKWLWFTPVLLVVPLLNSRTGLITFGIGVVVWLIYLIKEKAIKDYFKIFINGLLVILMLFIVVQICYPATAHWILRDFLSFFTNISGTADVLFSNKFWRLPGIVNIIFGSGYGVAAFGNLTNVLGFSSDVGYINEIWKTGLIGLILMTWLFIRLAKTIWKNNSTYIRYLLIFIAFSIFVVNIKFYVFSYNPVMVILLLMFLFSINKEKKDHIKKSKKTNTKSLVSVVVPIYKVEKYVKKCIDSIINQTYSNMEIILVDDGSPDNCGAICDEYAKKDKRIKVIHKSNGGLSDARNTGLKVAKGGYICFVDSDDFVSEFYIEKLLNAAIENDADIAACNFLYIDEEGNTKARKEVKDRIYSSKEAIKDIFTTTQNTEVMVWNKLYKTNLFKENAIQFPKGKIHEDNFTTYKLYDKANKIALINDKLYYYLQRNNSIMSTFNKNRFDILTALDEINKYFRDRKNFKDEIEYNELLIYFGLINSIIRNNYQGPEKNEIQHKIIMKKKEYLKNPYISFRRKLMIMIISKDMDLYAKIFLLLKR